MRLARERRDEVKRLIVLGIDPAIHKQAQKAAASDSDTFESVAREFLRKFAHTWADSHRVKVERRFEKDLFPYIGKRPIKEVNAPEVLAVLRRIESRGAIETAHRAKQSAGQVFRYAVATGRAERDPTGDLRGALPPPKKGRHAAITDPVKVGELLRAINAYGGSQIVRASLQLLALVFQLRQGEWSEIDWEAKQWVIPAQRVKRKKEQKNDPNAAHVVPLSEQALVVLRDMHGLSGHGGYIFPSARTKARPLSDNGARTALRAMGYSNDEMTPHGFRAMASTLLNEQGWPPDVIERQLSHTEENKVRAAYLDALRDGADVIPIHKKV